MRYLSFLIKPASSICNLRCKYCFYADEAKNRDLPSAGIMSEDTAFAVIERAYAETEKGGGISFAFQGGEPTVAGLPFFRRFVEKAKETKPDHVGISFSIQTNGTLLDEEWADFLHEEGFLVGLSVDGSEALHDKYRTDPDGAGSFGRVLRAKKLLEEYKVDFNALCVVTKDCALQPARVYESLKELGFEYIQFIACLDFIGKKRGSLPWSLKPRAYGSFLCSLFDLWFRDWENGNYHSVRLFDDYINVLIGNGAATCATCGNCGGYFVVEGDGSVYPCDFFCMDEYRAGNICTDTLREIRDSKIYQDFLQRGRVKPLKCASCRFRMLCHGGCVNDWEMKNGMPENYYCDAFKKLFYYTYDRMCLIAREEIAARRNAVRERSGS